MANERNTDHVTIGCKLPSGVYLELIDVPPNPAPGLPPNMNPRPPGQRIKLNGANSVQQHGVLNRVQPLVLEYGTTIVPKEFWDKWAAHNKDLAFMKNGQVFVVQGTDARSFNAQAREKLPEKTGFEGIAPNGDDPRLKQIAREHPGVKIETDKEQITRLQKGMEQAA